MRYNAIADIKLSELVKSVKKMTDEELQFADSGLRKMLAVVQQEIESREVKRKKERKNRKKLLTR